MDNAFYIGFTYDDGTYGFESNTFVNSIAATKDFDIFTINIILDISDENVFLSIYSMGIGESIEPIPIEDSTNIPYAELHGRYFKKLSDIPDDFQIYIIQDGKKQIAFDNDEIEQILQSKEKALFL